MAQAIKTGKNGRNAIENELYNIVRSSLANGPSGNGAPTLSANIRSSNDHPLESLFNRNSIGNITSFTDFALN